VRRLKSLRRAQTNVPFADHAGSSKKSTRQWDLVRGWIGARFLTVAEGSWVGPSALRPLVGELKLSVPA
jgi:hypothetical protein